MTPDDVNRRLATLFHLTRALYATTELIWDHLQGDVPYSMNTYTHKHIEMIQYFKRYDNKTDIFNKLLEFRLEHNIGLFKPGRD